MKSYSYVHGKGDIAVIGMACRFPDADDYQSFWCNLQDERNSVKKVSPQRWALSGLKEKISAPAYCAAIEGIDLFDHDFFKLSRREVESMDPQQRLVLEEAFHCIEDAGVAMATLRYRVTSVYLGITGSDYSLLALNRGRDVDSHAAFGNFECLAANRISHAFGFRGASFSLDAATASSLVAVHEAKKSLLLGESDFALTAAVSLPFHPWRYTGFDKASMLSPDGQCKAFDSHANGFVYGDGVAVLLLQRLDDAIRDGNHVHGVIRGSTVNHCGHSQTITTPSVAAQRDAVLAAWADANLSLETAGYMEAHGTGTAIGDPVEIEALTQAFAQHTSRQGFCKIGSVKSNIGHLFSAAGLAGLIKVLLMLRHRRVPKTLNIDKLNPEINFAASPFLPAHEAGQWPVLDDGSPRRAGVSAIGFGGVNAHVVLEEFQCEPSGATADIQTDSVDELPFLLSAKTPAALQDMLQQWRRFVTSDDFAEASFTDLCLTLALGRESMPYRFAVCLRDNVILPRVIERSGDETVEAAGKGWYLHLAGLTPVKAQAVAQEWWCYEAFQRHFHEVSQAVYEVDPSVAAWVDSREAIPSRVFAFAVEYACVRVLLELVVAPQQLTVLGQGLWAGLAVTGILSSADAAALLLNQCEWKEAKLHRPRAIPFYDSAEQRLIMPWGFDATYLAALIDGVCIPSQVVSELVGRARLLINSQSSFNKYMDEWGRILEPAGLDLQVMLRSPLPAGKNYPFASQSALLALVISSALCKFSHQRGLSDPLLSNDVCLREIVDLLLDGVMPQFALVDLFSRGPEAVAAVAETLAQRQARMNLAQPYTRIREYSQRLDNIEDPHVWFQHALDSVDMPAVPVGGMTTAGLRLDFGTKSKLCRHGQADEVFDMGLQTGLQMDTQTGSGFIALLVGLWRHGIDVEWGKLYPEGSFHKVSLPVYPFQREAHWLAPVSTEEIEFNSVSAAPPLPSFEEQQSAHASRSSASIQEYLMGLFAKELRTPRSELAEDTPFSELGVNSILVAGLVKNIEKWLGEKLDPTVILEYPTIAQLSAYLTTHFASRITAQGTVSGRQSGGQSDQVVIPVPDDSHASTVSVAKSMPGTGSRQVDETGITGKVAVIGVACHFPEAPDKDAFWRNLVAGRNSIVEVPAQRWDVSQYYSSARGKHKSISKWGGFIKDIEYFDPEYFGLKADMASHIDPLVRQFLETAVQTFSDAGYSKPDLAGQRVGVFVGSRSSNYRNRISSLLPETVLGVDQNFIASHVSHLFDLRGPNVVLDSACSSSLMSIHTACRSLQVGDCEMALAGGVDILLDENQYLMLSECQALSPDGRCFTFDERANGFVPGEGSGAVLLKPLATAIRDGDSIYAIVDGSAVNNDGRTMGVTTPNPSAQQDVIVTALHQAGVSAADISYVEAHGTGTMIGDPIELRALSEVFGRATDDRQFCAVGSVKTNIGHLLCAAGVAGFIKVVLSLHHKQLPATLNCEHPNSRFDFKMSPFYPNIGLSDWQPRGGLRRAGVSSFGFAGTNVHAVLGEFNPECFQLPYQQRRRSLPPVRFNRRRFWIDKEQYFSGGSGGGRASKRDLSPAGIKPFMELIDETQ